MDSGWMGLLLTVLACFVQLESQIEELRNKLDVETAAKSEIANSTKNLTSLQKKVIWNGWC